MAGPDGVLELHSHERSTAMSVPLPAAEGADRHDRRVQVGDAEEMMTALLDVGGRRAYRSPRGGAGRHRPSHACIQ